MKQLLLFVIFILLSFLYTYSITAQNDIKDYKPPKLIKGNNLTFQFQPDFFTAKDTAGNKSTDYHFLFNPTFSNWRFTEKFLYSVSVQAIAAVSHNESSNINSSNSYNNDAMHFSIDGGSSLYLGQSKFYLNLFLHSDAYFANHSKPNSNFEIYPGIGYGRLYNAASVSRMINFERALFSQHLISNPLNNGVKKKLTELLDKRNEGEFLSMFKEDNEIEFFSKIEDCLKEANVINENLSSRNVLRLYQALHSSTYIYYPVYKGYLIQAESKIYTWGRNDTTWLRSFNEFMLSGVYGLPINNKLNFLGSAYLIIPISTGNSLSYNLQYNFHSPITLIDQQSLYYRQLLSQNYYNNGEIYVKTVLSLGVNGYYSFNSFAGVQAGANTLIKFKNTKSIYNGNFNLNFDFNILNKLGLSIGANITRNYPNEEYYISMSGRFFYYIF